MAVWLIAAVVLMATAAPTRAASVLVHIDLSDQEMQVSVGGRLVHTWPVSTARRGYRTPTGRYRPTRLARVWYSTIYDYAPMPYSIFFKGGYAIHGTTEIRNLGRPASHGCVRLHPDNARALFELIEANGKASTEIVIVP